MATNGAVRAVQRGAAMLALAGAAKASVAQLTAGPGGPTAIASRPTTALLGAPALGAPDADLRTVRYSALRPSSMGSGSSDTEGAGPVTMSQEISVTVVRADTALPSARHHTR